MSGTYINKCVEHKYSGKVTVAQIEQVERQGHLRSWSDWRGMKRKVTKEL